MSYCKYCGTKLDSDCNFCPSCGGKVDNDVPPTSHTSYTYPSSNQKDDSSRKTLVVVTKVFLVIGCIASLSFLLPLLWTVPITIIIWNKLDKKEHISILSKIVVLLFVNIVAGALLLVDETE